MGKHIESDVRGHSQEREWLLNLGDGNILNGVRSLIDNLTDKNSDNNDYHYAESKRRRFLKWRD